MAFEVRTAVAAAKTNQDGRALLGIAVDYLRQAYALVPHITTMGIDIGDVQRNATQLLDSVNAYAQGIYAMIPDDQAPLDETIRARIQVALLQAQSDMKLVASVDAELEVNYLQALLGAISAGIVAVASAAAGAAFDQWPVTLAILVMIVLAWKYVLPAARAVRA